MLVKLTDRMEQKQAQRLRDSIMNLDPILMVKLMKKRLLILGLQMQTIGILATKTGCPIYALIFIGFLLKKHHFPM